MARRWRRRRSRRRLCVQQRVIHSLTQPRHCNAVHPQRKHIILLIQLLPWTYVATGSTMTHETHTHLVDAAAAHRQPRRARPRDECGGAQHPPKSRRLVAVVRRIALPQRFHLVMMRGPVAEAVPAARAAIKDVPLRPRHG